MENDLFLVLFQTPVFKGKYPLFKSQTELATLIYEKSKHSYSSLNSLKTYLNRIINGVKPASKNLQDQIKEVISLKINDSKQIKKISNDLDIAFQNLEYERLHTYNQTSIGDEDELIALENAIKEASYHLIIRDDPAELDFSKIANKFKNSMLENLGIIEDTNFKKKYEFYVGTEERAKMFWISLFEYLVKDLELSKEDAYKELIRVNDPESMQNLFVFTISSIIATSRFSAYDIVNSQKRKVFIVNYHEMGTKVSISTIPSDKLEGFYTNVYLQIKLEPEKHNIKEVRFEDSIKPNINNGRK